jgi:ABC-type cobalamin/Fe3+-siderophores transport system ATPase subunit
LLRAADVTYSYHARETPVLRGVSLDVPPDGFVGILGPNGSGKTTLLRVLAGTLRPAGGRVMLDTVDLAHVSRTMLARRMAVVPQDTHLAFDFTAIEVVLMGRYPHLSTFEVEGPRDIAIARAALTATGTLALEDRLFATLSGGEKQRVVIAAALAQISGSDLDCSARRDDGGRTGGGQAVNRESGGQAVIHDSRPGPTIHGSRPGPGIAAAGIAAAAKKSRSDPGTGILLLDEPTAALDLAYQLEVATLLRDLQRRAPIAIAIVISTHDLNFAAGLCRTLVLLKEGRVLAAGPTAEVLTAANIRTLYGVEAEVQSHAGAGHLVVVPMHRIQTEEPS